MKEFESDRPHGPWLSRGCDVWDAICGVVNGDAGAPGRVLQRDPKPSKYDQPLYFAAREGHLDAAQAQLDAGSGEELLAIAPSRYKARWGLRAM